MKKSKQFLSILLTAALVSAALSTAAFAADYDTKMEFYQISNGVAQPVSAVSYLLGRNENAVKVKRQVRQEDSATICTVTIQNTQSLTTEDDKLALADEVLYTVGYSEQEIENMDSDSKITLVLADELQVKTTYYEIDKEGETEPVSEEAFRAGQNSGSTVRETSWMKSTLAYGRTNTSRYFVGNTCSWIGVPAIRLTDHISIAVQGFAADYDTAQCQYSYRPIVNGVAKDTVRLKYDQYDSNFKSMGGNQGAGAVFDLTLLPTTASTSYDSITAFISCNFDNSLIDIGRTFNIYGSYAHQTVSAVGGVSISFPWGVSSTIGTAFSYCQTQMSATRY